MRSASGIGPGDDVGMAVVIEIAGGHEDTAAEAGVIGEEAADGAGKLLAGQAVEHTDVRPAARTGSRDDVGRAVAVDIAGRNAEPPENSGS